MFGLMTVKAHKEEVEFQKEMRAEWKASAKDWEAKFKKAITDLAAAQDEIASLRPDAEWARARKEKAADYEANRRVRKTKGAG